MLLFPTVESEELPHILKLEIAVDSLCYNKWDLVFTSVATIKHTDQEGCRGVHFSIHFQIINRLERSQGKNSKQEVESRKLHGYSTQQYRWPYGRSNGRWCLPTGSQMLIFQPAFLRSSSLLREDTSHYRLDPWHQLIIKIISHRHYHRPNLPRQFLIWGCPLRWLWAELNWQLELTPYLAKSVH